MRGTQVYIEGKRLDLFDDEQITVKSSQQSISDITKVMTDYSQSFNIPASPKNNAILQHFYQSDVDSTIDHNVRREALIEIDLSEFRRGKISIEGSTLTSGKPDSYSITFYGENISLKDKFGEETLSDISELEAYTFDYTGANVKASVSSSATDDDIRFPLITPRILTYGDGASTDINPSTGAGAIHYDELSPAIKVKSIFSAIESRYDLSFTGTFLDADRFKKAFLWCKNANDFKFFTQTVDMDFVLSSSDPSNDSPLFSADYFNIDTNTLSYNTLTFGETFPTYSAYTEFWNEGHYVEITTTGAVANEPYFVDISDNGSLINTVEITGNVTDFILMNDPEVTLNRSLTFKIRSTSISSMVSVISYRQTGFALTVPIVQPSDIIRVDNKYSVTTDYALTGTINTLSYLPEMKVVDFFKGVLEMFNMTCYGAGTNTFQIEPISDWYSKGAIVDITEHVITDSISIDKVPLYNKISFKYEDSKLIANKAFTDTFGRGYGDTTSSFDYDDGSEFSIKLPFENLMFNKFTDTGLQVGFSVDEAGNKATPKPVIVYMNGTKEADFGFNDGSHNDLTNYVVFGQDLDVSGVDYSLNFGADNSTLTNTPITQGLFATYYFDYLGNLYNLKNRRTKLKAVFPTSLSTSLKLNDRLIIQGKRHLINEMSTNLTSGEVTLDLLSDFRDTLSEGAENGNTGQVDPLMPSLASQCMDVRIILPNKCVSATITDASQTTTSITPNVISEDSTVVICIPENSTGASLILTEDGLFNLATEDGSTDVLQEEGSGSSVVFHVLLITYTFIDGSNASNQIYIQQQP